MVCKHVNDALKKIGSLGDEVRGENYPLYGNLGPLVKYDSAKDCINTMSRWANETTSKGVEILKEEAIYGCGMLSPFFEKVIDRNVLRERMLEIINDLNKCNCVDMDDATRALKEQFVEVEVYERLKKQLREKEEEIRRLKENQRFEARQEHSSMR